MDQIIQNINTPEKTIEEATLPAVICLPDKSGELTAEDSKFSRENAASSGEKVDAMDQLKSLAPLAVRKLREILDSDESKPQTVIRVCEMILDRVYGKPDSSIKVTSVTQTVEQSREMLMTVFETVRSSRGMIDEMNIDNTSGLRRPE